MTLPVVYLQNQSTVSDVIASPTEVSPTSRPFWSRLFESLGFNKRIIVKEPGQPPLIWGQNPTERVGYPIYGGPEPWTPPYVYNSMMGAGWGAKGVMHSNKVRLTPNTYLSPYPMQYALFRAYPGNLKRGNLPTGKTPRLRLFS